MTKLFVPGSFRLDRMRNASAQVFDHLRERIISLDLKPGVQLQRDELAAYFELSSTPIRDALTRLGEEGLVDIVPKQTTAVRAIDVESARQAHFLRLSLELEIVHMLARESGRPILPVAIATSRFKRLNNWDRSVIHLPFGRGVIAGSDLIWVPRDADNETMQALRLQLEERLNDVTRRAYQLVGRPDEGLHA